MNEENKQRGDELFEKLSKDKKQRRRKIIRTVVILIVVLAALAVVALTMLRRNVQQRFAGEAADVLDYQVSAGTIHTVVTGTGVLEEVDQEEIAAPAGVEVTQILVRAGDTVAKGDVLAAVDMPTVLTALSDMQEALDDLDDEIQAAKGDTVSTYITAGVSGRVKRIFVEKDMDVSLCMAEHGALVILSMDGCMAADIQTDKVSAGETVSVTRADGTVIEGTVDTVTGGKATILVTDNGPQYDEEVTIASEDGTALGTARLYIHKPLGITGYAGTISSISVQENSKVSSGSTIVSLKNTSFSANYDALLRDRADMEETLMDLLTIYRDGAIVAPMDGRISSVDFDADSEDHDFTVENQLMTLFPNESMSITISIDETDILSLKDGQEAEVIVYSISEEEVFPAVVTDIGKVADTSSGVTRYSAEVTLDVADGMLPGMTAEVDVKIEGVENALLIPVDALHQTSAIYYVYTSYNEETQQYGGMTEVTIGMQNDTQVEILSGLKEGDTVYYTEAPQSMFPFAMGQGGGMPGGMGGMPGGMSGMPSGGGMPDRGSMPGGGGMPSGMPGGRG